MMWVYFSYFATSEDMISEERGSRLSTPLRQSLACSAIRFASDLPMSIRGLMFGLKTADNPFTRYPDECICLVAKALFYHLLHRYVFSSHK